MQAVRRRRTEAQHEPGLVFGLRVPGESKGKERSASERRGRETVPRGRITSRDLRPDEAMTPLCRQWRGRTFGTYPLTGLSQKLFLNRSCRILGPPTVARGKSP